MGLWQQLRKSKYATQQGDKKKKQRKRERERGQDCCSGIELHLADT